MSSGSKPRSLVTTHNDAQARPDSKLTLAVSIDEHSSRVTSNSSMEDTLAAGGEGKKSMAPDPAHPTDPLGHDSPDAGSVASEGGANKTRTSSRSRRSRNGGEKQNEGMLYKEPVSTLRELFDWPQFNRLPTRLLDLLARKTSAAGARAADTT